MAKLKLSRNFGKSKILILFNKALVSKKEAIVVSFYHLMQENAQPKT